MCFVLLYHRENRKMWKFNQRWMCCPWISLFLVGLCPVLVQSLQDIYEGRRDELIKTWKLCCVWSLTSALAAAESWLSWYEARLTNGSNQLCRNLVLHYRKPCLPVRARACPPPSHFNLQETSEGRFPPRAVRKYRLSLPATLFQPWDLSSWAEGLEKLNKL